MWNIRLAVPDEADAACEVLRASINELCVLDHENDPNVLNRSHAGISDAADVVTAVSPTRIRSIHRNSVIASASEATQTLQCCFWIAAANARNDE
jgi:hypothetical protein